ncbi:alpha/beta hydrolase [Nostoc sp. NIES-2111]
MTDEISYASCYCDDLGGDMVSDPARRFWKAVAAAPKQIDLPLPARRAAGEHAEDATAEPTGVRYEAIADSGSFLAVPSGMPPDRAMLYLFGGGYVLGSPASRRKTAGHLALASPAKVLVADYRLAPEHPFPAALDDAVSAYLGLLGMGVDPHRTIIAGDSAGGGLAVAFGVALRDNSHPMPAGIVALSPWADLTCSGTSMTGNASRDIECSRAGLLQMAGWYMNGADPAQPLASPVFASFSDMPPLLCLVGSEEVLLDDSLRLARRMAVAGGEATVTVAAGMQHVYPIWAGAFPEAGRAIRGIGEWVSEQIDMR